MPKDAPLLTGNSWCPPPHWLAPFRLLLAQEGKLDLKGWLSATQKVIGKPKLYALIKMAMEQVRKSGQRPASAAGGDAPDKAAPALPAIPKSPRSRLYPDLLVELDDPDMPDLDLVADATAELIQRYARGRQGRRQSADLKEIKVKRERIDALNQRRAEMLREWRRGRDLAAEVLQRRARKRFGKQGRRRPARMSHVGDMMQHFNALVREVEAADDINPYASHVSFEPRALETNGGGRPSSYSLSSLFPASLLLFSPHLFSPHLFSPHLFLRPPVVRTASRARPRTSTTVSAWKLNNSAR